jgi:hypothetical protein
MTEILDSVHHARLKYPHFWDWICLQILVDQEKRKLSLKDMKCVLFSIQGVKLFLSNRPTKVHSSITHSTCRSKWIQPPKCYGLSLASSNKCPLNFSGLGQGWWIYLGQVLKLQIILGDMSHIETWVSQNHVSKSSSNISVTLIGLCPGSLHGRPGP